MMWIYCYVKGQEGAMFYYHVTTVTQSMDLLEVLWFLPQTWLVEVHKRCEIKWDIMEKEFTLFAI